MSESLQIDTEGLSPAAKAALAALRAEEAPPAEALERVWSRVVVATELAEGTGVDADEAAPRGPSRRRAAWALGAVALAAGVVLAIAGTRGAAVPVAREATAPAAQYGGETGASQAARVGQGQAAAVAETAAPVAQAASAGPAAPGSAGAGGSEPARAGDVSEGEGASGQVPGDRSQGTGKRRGEARDAGDARGEEVEAKPAAALAREAALLQQAQAALASERPEQALAHLATYDREFADGVLRPEHDALRAVALCAAGRTAEGEAAADVFLRGHAGSLQAERVRGACGAD
ncbi:MAG: hypothetical protein JNL82_07345 [Myxococcales bacterium]|nr:hypothetical protein [Myxococcales bacterium]